MSKLPALLREFIKPIKLLENHMTITEDYFRPKFKLEFLDKNEIIQNKDKIHVKVKIPDFRPDEISVKAVHGNAIQVEARQKEDANNKVYLGKYYLRRFIVPYGTDLKQATSTLSKDGVLTITAPRVLKDTEEKIIPIIVENLKDSNNLNPEMNEIN